MLRLFRKQRGAVSIFLIIVLVPILMVSSIFVDMSRIKLAGAMAESAGDLTLNTALTNYDAVLKDMYGLFATSQDMDELFLNLEDYYRQSIEAAGVPEDNVDSYVDQVMSFLKTSTGTDDLMNITVTDFNASVPADGHLGNPAVMKTQIVEFMKYRGPINLGMGLFDAITGMTKLDEQTKLVDNKTEFYGKQQDLLNELENGWSDLVKYQYTDAVAGFPTGDYIKNQTADMDAIKVVLHDKIVPNTVKYLNDYGTYIQTADIGNQKVAQSGTTWSFAGNICNPADSGAEEVSVQTVIGYANNVNASIGAIEAMEQNVQSLLTSATGKSPIEKIYILRKYQTEYRNSYGDAIQKLEQYLVNLNYAIKLCDEEELKKASAGGTTAYIWCNTQLGHLSLAGNTYFTRYNHHMTTLGTLYSDTTYLVESSKTEADTKIKEVATKASTFYKDIDANITHLSNAIGHFQSVSTMLTDPNSGYNQALTAWNNAANGLSDETMGQNDLEEIAKVKDMVTLDRVNGLITRLTGAMTSLETVKAEIEKYEFEGVKWKDIPTDADYNTVNSYMSSRNISGIEVNNKNAYDTVIDNVQATIKTGTITTTWNEEVSPDLTKSQRELHTWLYKNYGVDSYKTSTTTNKTDSKDSDVDSIKDNLKSQADSQNSKTAGSGSTKVSTNVKDYMAYLPSTVWKNEKSSSSTSSTDALNAGEVETDQDKMMESSNGSAGLGTLLTGITDAVNNMATSLRDKLYVTDYVMNMFSYDTYEAEIVAQEEGKATAFENWYEKKDDVYVIKDGSKKYEALALNMTNNPINPNNNYLYGSEVEYIIYGNEDPTKSVDAAYGTIFMIRFAFNTVYAFTDAEINNIAMAAATAVFGTPPLTPLIPIAKVAIILGFAIAESAYDLYQLKCGAAVPLMKNKKTWVMSGSGAVKQIASEVATTVVDKAIEEGTELLNNALEATDEELTAMLGEEGVLDKLADQVVNNSFEQLYNYANEALQQTVQLCNDVNLSQQFINEANAEDAKKLLTKEGKAELVAEKLTTWLGTAESDDDVFYEVKKIAVEKLKENNNANIIIIFDSIESTAGIEYTGNLDASGTLKPVLEEIKNNVNLEIDKLTSAANSKLSKYKEQLKTSISDAASKGADTLRSTINEKITGALGSPTKISNSSAPTNVISSLMTWTYSDYLNLFLLVSVIANEEGVLLRIADVIELNMQHMNKQYAAVTTTETVTKSRLWGLIQYEKEETTTTENAEAFKLRKAYTHIQIDATLEVEPLFMDMPFMKDTTDSILSGKNWYQVQYSGTLGY